MQHIVLGYLTATASEDWDIVLEVCERASATEASAKEAVRALRREFRYDYFFILLVSITDVVSDMESPPLNYLLQEYVI